MKTERKYNGVPERAFNQLRKLENAVFKEWDKDTENISLHKMVRASINVAFMCLGDSAPLDDLKESDRANDN